MTTTTIRDGVILLLVLVKKSAAKTHIYYSIYISLLFSSHEVLETNNVREREKRFRSVLSSAPSRCFFLPFFHAWKITKFFSFPRKREKMYPREKGKRKKISSFFLTHTTSISSSHTRAYTKNHLSKEECIIVA